jgi:hypothetical protein
MAKQIKKGQTTQWPKENGNQKKMETRTNNTMAKRKWKQGQTIQWPQEHYQ